jgi:hypothetical protein
MYKGIGPNKLGSPLKQTTKQPVNLPPAWSSQKAKDDYKKYSDNYVQESAAAFAKRPKATGAINVDNTIESLAMGGGVVKGTINAAKNATKGRVAKALGTKAAHQVAEAAHLAEVGHHIGG